METANLPKMFRGNPLPFLFSFLLLAPFPVWAKEAPEKTAVAAVKETKGTLKVTRGQATLDLTPGSLLYGGDRLESGSKDKAFLELASDETLLKVGTDTTLVFSSKKEAPVFLLKGLVWGKKITNAPPFVIQAPMLIVVTRGAQFFLKIKGAQQAVILVKDGTVQVGFGGGISEVNPMTLGTFKRKKKPRLETADDRTFKEWDKEFTGLS